jgi:hypothetical protein
MTVIPLVQGRWLLAGIRFGAGVTDRRISQRRQKTVAGRHHIARLEGRRRRHLREKQQCGDKQPAHTGFGDKAAGHAFHPGRAKLLNSDHLDQ